MQLGYGPPGYMWTTFPVDALRHYEQHNLILCDPGVAWARRNSGWIDWADLRRDDEQRVYEQARSFGMNHGMVVSIPGDDRASVFLSSRRSYASFTRGDRRFTRVEAQRIHGQMAALHFETGPMQPLSKATRQFLMRLSETLTGGNLKWV